MTTTTTRKAQFRLGPLGEPLDRLAHQWGVSVDEASRRATALAVNGLDLHHHAAVAEGACYVAARRERHAFCYTAKFLGSVVADHRARGDLTIGAERRILKNLIRGLKRSASKEFQSNGTK